MKRFGLLLIGVLLVITTNCNNQQLNNRYSSNNLSFIKNDKLHYNILLVACDTCVPIINKGYRVRVKLTDKQKSIVKKIKKEMWRHLLSDKKTDFAANLILYDIYDKDAILLFGLGNNIRDWRKNLKRDDTSFWLKKLK